MKVIGTECVMEAIDERDPPTCGVCGSPAVTYYKTVVVLMCKDCFEKLWQTTQILKGRQRPQALADLLIETGSTNRASAAADKPQSCRLSPKRLSAGPAGET